MGSAARRAVAGAAAGWILALAGCAPDAGPPPSGDATLLVTIDTLRGDAVGCGGDPSARTPVFDRLARSGAQFAVAVSPVPLTLPSHTSIHSGLVPPEHGARNNGFYRVEERVPLLAEAFAAAGRETAGFVAAFPLARRFGLDRGFAVYRDTGGLAADGEQGAYPERSADAVNADVHAWLDARTEDRPAFLWIHYFDPHSPYVPHGPLRPADDRAAYAGEIAFADRQLGELLAMLRDRFAAVRICVTADHGESLGEHQEESHGIFVYEATTRVPLAFAGPDVAAGQLFPRPAPLTRIAATLLAWSGVDGTADRFPQEPFPVTAALVPDRRGDRRFAEPVYVESLLPEERLGWAPLRGLRGERWKVIRAPEPELYDLDADPGELRNLHDDPAAREAAATLLDDIEDPRWDARPVAPSPVDERTEAMLATLGYVGGTGTPTETTDLPDPKSRIAINRHLMNAYAALGAGRIAAARGALSRALSVDSRHKEAYLLLAEVEVRSGNPKAALADYEFALTLQPAALDPVVHAGAGKTALDAGWNDVAERHLAEAAKGNPLDADVLFNWGTAAYRAGRFDDAVARWQRALALDPDHPSARRWLPDAEARRDGRTPEGGASGR
jgi:choline-sulfatase